MPVNVSKHLGKTALLRTLTDTQTSLWTLFNPLVGGPISRREASDSNSLHTEDFSHPFLSLFGLLEFQ